MLRVFHGSAVVKICVTPGFCETSKQTVMSSDMNLFDLLDDSFLKGDVKDELFADNYGDDVIAVSPEKSCLILRNFVK